MPDSLGFSNFVTVFFSPSSQPSWTPDSARMDTFLFMADGSDGKEMSDSHMAHDAFLRKNAPSHSVCVQQSLQTELS